VPSQEPRQPLGQRIGAHPRDQREPARLIVRIEHVDQLEKRIGLQRRAALEPDRIGHPLQKLDMRVVRAAGPFADPKHMGRTVVPVARERVLSRQGFLVVQQQGVVTRIKFGLAQRLHRVGRHPARIHKAQRLHDAARDLAVAHTLRRGGDEPFVPFLNAKRSSSARDAGRRNGRLSTYTSIGRCRECAERAGSAESPRVTT
jgi:hypothetical protein